MTSIRQCHGRLLCSSGWKVFWLAILAGAYIGLGAAFFLSVGGQMPGVQSTNLGLQKLVLGAFGLPMSLGLILVCGAELLTANSAYISAAVFEVTDLDFMHTLSLNSRRDLFNRVLTWILRLFVYVILPVLYLSRYCAQLACTLNSAAAKLPALPRLCLALVWCRIDASVVAT